MFNAQDIILARQFKPDLSISKLDTESLILLKIMNHARGGGVVPVYDADITNGIASFDGVMKSKPLVSLKLNIPVTQTGSGTPSPDNIRDFIGFSSVNIGHISGSEYREYFAGIFKGTHGFADMGTLTWNLNTNYEYPFFTAVCDGVVIDPVEGKIITVASSKYTPFGSTYFSIYGNGDYNLTISKIKGSNSQRLMIQDSDYSDPNVFKNSLSGNYVIYELETPGSFNFTDAQFQSLCNAFNITGNTYQITFGQTVYSANLDVLNGKLSVTHELKTIDENSGVQIAENGILFLNSFFEIDEDTESVNCNVYQRGENRGTVAQVNAYNPDSSFCCKLGTNADRLMIKDTRFTSVEDYKTWLSTNPVKIAVKLATPIEIDLTPTVINTLIGENVIFADVGDITECKYTRK